MSLEDTIFASLKTIPALALAGGKFAVHPVNFPQAPAVPVWPAIRYTFISGIPVQDLCGDGDDDSADTRTQLDCVGRDFAECRALRLAVMVKMAAISPPAILELSIDEYDAETKTFRSILDYVFHPSST